MLGASSMRSPWEIRTEKYLSEEIVSRLAHEKSQYLDRGPDAEILRRLVHEKSAQSKENCKAPRQARPWEIPVSGPDVEISRRLAHENSAQRNFYLRKS